MTFPSTCSPAGMKRGHFLGFGHTLHHLHGQHSQGEPHSFVWKSAAINSPNMPGLDTVWSQSQHSAVVFCGLSKQASRQNGHGRFLVFQRHHLDTDCSQREAVSRLQAFFGTSFFGRDLPEKLLPTESAHTANAHQKKICCFERVSPH